MGIAEERQETPVAFWGTVVSIASTLGTLLAGLAGREWWTLPGGIETWVLGLAVSAFAFTGFRALRHRQVKRQLEQQVAAAKEAQTPTKGAPFDPVYRKCVEAMRGDLHGYEGLVSEVDRIVTMVVRAAMKSSVNIDNPFLGVVTLHSSYARHHFAAFQDAVEGEPSAVRLSYIMYAYRTTAARMAELDLCLGLYLGTLDESKFAEEKVDYARFKEKAKAFRDRWGDTNKELHHRLDMSQAIARSSAPTK